MTCAITVLKNIGAFALFVAAMLAGGFVLIVLGFSTAHLLGLHSVWGNLFALGYFVIIAGISTGISECRRYR